MLEGLGRLNIDTVLSMSPSLKAIARYLLIRTKMVFRWLGADRLAINRYVAGATIRKLHLGAGSNILPGWLNVDYFPIKTQVVHFDATKKFLFDSEIFDFALNEHMIEHIPYQGARNMLQEIHRVLKPGGVLRISTPDLAFLIGLLDSDRPAIAQQYIDWTSAQWSPDATTGHESVYVLNNFFYNYGHCFIYTKALLLQMLSDAGFKAVTEQQILQSQHPDLVGLENVHKIPPGFLELESMIFEAVK